MTTALRLSRHPLASLIKKIATWSPSRSAPDDQFTYIDLSSIDQSVKCVGPVGRIACNEAPSRARQLVKTGDVLVSTVRPNLNGVALVPPELDGATASTGFCVLRADENRLHNRFLFHWVKSAEFVDDMTRKATGASYPAVSDRIIGDSTIPLPPPSEQRRIADILDRAEALRAKRRAVLAQLDDLSLATFVKMFGDLSSNAKNWQIESVSSMLTGGPQNGIYKPSHLYGRGTPILRIDAFYDGVVTDLHSLKRVELSDDERTLFGLQENDVVINRVNSIEYLGKCALIPHLTEPTVFESNMMRLRLDTRKVVPAFFTRVLQSKYVKNQILRRAKQAVNQASINQQDVLGFQVPLPPLRLQQEFASRVQAIDRLKAKQRQSLSEMDALFMALQHLAFQGKL